MERSIEVDLWLVAQTQFRATGENIHKVNNVLTAYYGYCSLGMKTEAEEQEKILRTFVVSGKIVRKE